jgi:hypothetical protein
MKRGRSDQFHYHICFHYTEVYHFIFQIVYPFRDILMLLQPFASVTQAETFIDSGIYFSETSMAKYNPIHQALYTV